MSFFNRPNQNSNNNKTSDGQVSVKKSIYKPNFSNNNAPGTLLNRKVSTDSVLIVSTSTTTSTTTQSQITTSTTTTTTTTTGRQTLNLLLINKTGFDLVFGGIGNVINNGSLSYGYYSDLALPLAPNFATGFDYDLTLQSTPDGNFVSKASVESTISNFTYANLIQYATGQFNTVTYYVFSQVSTGTTTTTTTGMFNPLHVITVNNPIGLNVIDGSLMWQSLNNDGDVIYSGSFSVGDNTITFVPESTFQVYMSNFSYYLYDGSDTTIGDAYIGTASVETTGYEPISRIDISQGISTRLTISN